MTETKIIKEIIDTTTSDNWHNNWSITRNLNNLILSRYIKKISNINLDIMNLSNFKGSTGEQYNAQQILRERFNVYPNVPLAEVWIE